MKTVCSISSSAKNCGGKKFAATKGDGLIGEEAAVHHGDTTKIITTKNAKRNVFLQTRLQNEF